MNTEAFGTTIFCDDIRHEINGKLTLVGCYSGDLSFNGPPPGMLPTFAALVSFRIPYSVTFESLKLKITKEEGDEVTEMMVVDIGSDDESLKNAINASEKEKSEGRVISIIVPFQWSPVPVSQPGFIRVRAYLDGDREVRLGSIKINFTEGAAAQ